MPITVQQTLKYQNKIFAPGDLFPMKAWRTLPQHIKSAWLGQRLVIEGKDNRVLSEEEQALDKQLRAATKTINDAQSSVEKIQQRIAATQEERATIAAAREPLVLKAAEGDAEAKAEADRLREQLVRVDLDIEDLQSAEKQAIAAHAAAKEEFAQLEKQRRFSEARRIIEERTTVAAEIEKHLKKLGPLTQQYLALGHAFALASGDTGRQITSNWRLSAVMDERLGLAPVPKSRRVEDLAEKEREMLTASLARQERTND